MATYTLNQEQHGIEISFEGKPNADTLTALKGAGFRWHRTKKIWYAKQTADRLTLAQSLTDGQTAAPAPSADIINLDGLGENAPRLHGAELATAIREDLKKRGVKGVTVRARRVTYNTGITVTIKATAADIVSIEEYQKRYSFSQFSCDAECSHGVFDGNRWIYAGTWAAMTEDERRASYESHTHYMLTKAPEFYRYHNERNEHPTMTTAFYNKVLAVYKIANQWNYDNSDSMSDYFDVGYYLDIDIKAPADFSPRQDMTEAERTAYQAEKDAEEAERAAQIERMRQEEEERRKAYEEAEKKRQADRQIIANNVIFYDLNEAAQLYITNLAGGAGKESTLDELTESITENPYREKQDALITRKVIFKTHEAYNAFCGLFLDDFHFIAGKGGTATEDVRIESTESFYMLNDDQQESVKWFLNDCVAIYDVNRLALVSNPEGYNYSRYTYILTDESEVLSAAPVLEDQRKESETKPEFYFPADIEEQAQALTEGQPITIYQGDGWGLSIYGGSGEVFATEPGTYAQYKGIYITLRKGKKYYKAFIRNGKKCLIYPGILPNLPDSVTRELIDEHMSKLYTTDELFPRIIDYYAKQGRKPIIDTIQR